MLNIFIKGLLKDFITYFINIVITINIVIKYRNYTFVYNIWLAEKCVFVCRRICKIFSSNQAKQFFRIIIRTLIKDNPRLDFPKRKRWKTHKSVIRGIKGAIKGGKILAPFYSHICVKNICVKKICQAKPTNCSFWENKFFNNLDKLIN